MLKKLFAGMIAFLFASFAYAAPVSLGTITHDYGLGAGQVKPTSLVGTNYAANSGCDRMFSSWVQITDKRSSPCSPFHDSFDLTGVEGTITSMVLTLTFSKTNTLGLFEDWRVHITDGKTRGAMMDLNLTNGQQMTQDFVLNSDTVSNFSDIVNGGLFSMWFGEETFFSADFNLYSASLEIIGESLPVIEEPVAEVPEPATTALLSAGLIGLIGMSRRKTKA